MAQITRIAHFVPAHQNTADHAAGDLTCSSGTDHSTTGYGAHVEQEWLASRSVDQPFDLDRLPAGSVVTGSEIVWMRVPDGWISETGDFAESADGTDMTGGGIVRYRPGIDR